MVDLLRWYCGGEPVEVTAHAAGNDLWDGRRHRGDDPLRLRKYGPPEGSTHRRRVERETRCLWFRSAEVRATEWVLTTVDGVTTRRELSAKAFGWATATETLGFAEAVHHFLDRIIDRKPPLTSGLDAVITVVVALCLAVYTAPPWPRLIPRYLKASTVPQPRR